MSGTSLADFDSCNRMTPEQITKKPMMMVAILIGVPLNPRKSTDEATMVELVK